ncbi:hypothetical protein EOK75_01440 [Pseudorhodobacter turbinis]|uniref:LysR substrate-binding domain-containing protein n=2 Tax=Pseudorhodobacter turbinis TaxID=2500533 RepID=A0A4P8ECT2_9RHOB|nr:LysR substrate-binding domain-containing protein [Pseudorhodobacter turbinis]QCO54586.1 hypothetical protein EOK75_01440 [Pseudorhodobacter turbinis]
MSFGTLSLSPMTAEFAAQHPELDLRVDYDDRARDLQREGFDIGIRIGHLRDTALRQRKLCEGVPPPLHSRITLNNGQAMRAMGRQIEDFDIQMVAVRATAEGHAPLEGHSNTVHCD